MRMVLKYSFAALVALALFAQTSKPPVRVKFNVPVRLRDGVTLAANVYLPKEEGRFPVILIRTPYGKAGGQDDGVFFAQHGYVVVAQDTRGRYDSDGHWYAFRHEADDGHDSIEWAAAQPWSNGKVVTMGASYLAIDQWLAATRGSRHLAAMIPFIGPSDLYLNTIHPGGAFQHATALTWSTWVGRHTPLDAEQKLLDWPELFRVLPVAAATADAYEANFLRDWIDHPARDSYWEAMSWREAYPRLAVPVMHIGGWFDIFQEGTVENFAGMTDKAPAQARAAQRLIMGPWAHGDYDQKVGDVDFGKQSVIDLRERELRWLDHYVRGRSNGAENDLPVEIFVMGTHEWRKEETWPPPGVAPVKYFLRSNGSANSSAGEGSLSTTTPLDEPPDRFDYDPSNPVPTQGGATCCDPRLVPWGPLDQQTVEKRQDVLVYSTPPLERDVEVTGLVEVRLFASTSARDTDWTVKLVDVSPDGFAMNLTDGILRARYRNSFKQAELLEPGKAYEFSINAGNTSNVFLKGHRIRLEVSSSNFPRFSRNTNTGNIPEKDRSFLTAHQTVYHDRARASSLLLPVRARE